MNVNILEFHVLMELSYLCMNLFIDRKIQAMHYIYGVVLSFV